MTNNAILLVDSHHGIYIPKLFAENYENNIIDVEKYSEELKDISNPENEFYFESWDIILDNVRLMSDTLHTEFFLYQNDGDLWAIPENESDQLTEF